MTARLVVSILAIVAVGCDPSSDPGPVQTGSSGIYVVNEGAFNAGNAELSYINADRSHVSGNVFSTTNPGRTLGDIAQHAQYANGEMFVVVNNSRKIEVVEPGTHRWLRTIALVRAPRAIEVVSPTKAYVTNMDSTVSVIDIAASIVTKDIVVGTNPEGLVSSGGRLYVCNGAWGYGTSVSVIDQATDFVISTISTPSGPSYAVKGSSGVIHVLCTGYSPWGGGSPDVPGAILTIDGPTGTVLDTLWLTQPASRIAADASGTLYVTGTSISGAAVWKVSGGLSPAVVSPNLVSGPFYGIGIDISRSELYLASAGDFVGNGTVQVHTFSGTLSRTHTSGIGVVPNGFVFVP